MKTLFLPKAETITRIFNLVIITISLNCIVIASCLAAAGTCEGQLQSCKDIFMQDCNKSKGCAISYLPGTCSSIDPTLIPVCNRHDEGGCRNDHYRCYWTSGAPVCVGDRPPCFRYTNGSDCNNNGCTWHPTPPPAPTPPCPEPLPPSADPNIVRKDVVAVLCPGDGPFGDWTNTVYCPVGFVTGYRLRSEGPTNDDTALNAIEITCTYYRQGMNGVMGRISYPIKPHEGFWGQWLEESLCPGKELIIGIEMKIEDNQGGKHDDAGAVTVDAVCSGGSRISGKVQLYDPGKWNGLKVCPTDSAICGVAARVESPQGHEKDDTALNGLRFACCDTKPKAPLRRRRGP